ncbi:hypothetical protein BJV77DRAFT_92888 [Russula vinacea]|nr:hypothetical protein BJV77DRAFT_92888 [Russula vinacea]
MACSVRAHSHIVIRCALYLNVLNSHGSISLCPSYARLITPMYLLYVYSPRSLRARSRRKPLQLQDPLPPMSEQPEDLMAYRTHIHTLDDDSLLQIFSCFRLEDEESWNLRFTWRKLVHVCRRWRYLIFDSSSHLGMCLPLSALTNDPLQRTP